MNRLKRVTLAVTLLLFGSEAALACRCAIPAASADLSPYAAVFMGRVVESKRVGASERVKFRVARVWKGEAVAEVTLILQRASDPRVISSCDIGFQKGEHYLVYARKWRDGQALTTHKCTRTRRVAQARQDFAVLGELAGEDRPKL